MQGVPWWAVVSSALAPILLIGGWTLAAARQGPGFSSVRDTISALAGRGAVDRWLMSVAFVGVGVCHLVTAAGLRPLGWPGRVLLALGGVATLAVAAFPVPAEGESGPHIVAAYVAFGALAIWSAFAWHAPASYVATVILVALALWLAVALRVDRARLGLVERLAAGAQAIWPLCVVVAVGGWPR